MALPLGSLGILGNISRLEKVEVKVECMGKGTYGSSVRTASGSASCSSKSVSKLHKSWIVCSSSVSVAAG